MTTAMSSAHSPTFPSLNLRHNSFYNPSIALPTSQLILQPFRCFTYVRVHSPTLLSLLLRHKFFTSYTWRAAHGKNHYGGRAYLVFIGSLGSSLTSPGEPPMISTMMIQAVQEEHSDVTTILDHLCSAVNIILCLQHMGEEFGRNSFSAKEKVTR